MVNKNIGAIRTAIEKGIKAEANIDYGPVTDPYLAFLPRPVTADFQLKPTNPTAFIMGIHRWGDTNHQVT
jgi:hypothetical protein